MGSRMIRLVSNEDTPKCPKCGNNTVFKIRSEQVAEDNCDVWVVCKCGYDPTKSNTLNRMEDVWGSLDDDTCLDAVQFTWSDIINKTRHTPPMREG